MKPYNDIRPTLRTFDILCCDHKDWLWNLIGHVGMIIRDKEKDVLMIWQSTTKYAGIKGTSLSFLNEWLTDYPGSVFVRRMSMPVTVRFTAEGLLDDYIKEHRDHPYPDLKSIYGLRYMWNQVIDFLPWTVNDPEPKDDARDCSDRIAHTLLKCRLLEDYCNPSEIEPDDFRYPGRPLHKSIDKYLMPKVILRGEEQLK